MLLLDKEQEVDRLNEKLSGQYEDLRELIKIYEYMNGKKLLIFYPKWRM